MLALDIAAKCGVTFNIGNKLYVLYVEGDPVFQGDYLRGINTEGIVAIESLNAFNAFNKSTLVTIAKRYGYISNLLSAYDNEIVELHDASWKKWHAIKGKSAEVKAWNNSNITDIVPHAFTLDESDSIAVWLAAARLHYKDLQDYEVIRLKRVLQKKKNKTTFTKINPNND